VSAGMLPRTRLAREVAVGDRLPEEPVAVTPTLVVSTALATRDFQDVHHDRDLARRRGSPDIFLNILTSTGLVQRYVTDWAGPQALVRGISVRLGAPCYPYDTLRLNGEVTSVEGPAALVVTVTGSVERGDHVVATVRLQLPEETT
jgi:acyl dehydratase